MRLVFVHGWGFDASFWDDLAGALPEFDAARVELGFLGREFSLPTFSPDDVLIGHSLGFLWGATQYQGWSRMIAINAFAEFSGEMGVASASLRAMRTSLKRDPQKTLANFYASLNGPQVPREFQAERLAEGLAWLQDWRLGEKPGVPSLVLSGAKDPLLPARATTHLAEMLDAPARLHETGGHLLPLSDPKWCAAAIRAFLA
ncbi:pimeloyl-[acyl-carrier protein] methyl ester esterase [Rhizomicrobium palustre]|uniref:Pimeloyl-[acyl-carrier protein] methyl ester esterase n=1 Tax=Rhizomicrobium palustre TaxID=189966 RepID=A0A846N0T8_9PROT|nr:alpha/beta hydrolase [Rhizomicrobium palustre]NIK89095.1 pimeloyl-[acyl-carrier protein] methyl ester esterase [Rhizomicrobium palustre]